MTKHGWLLSAALCLTLHNTCVINGARAADKSADAQARQDKEAEALDRTVDAAALTEQDQAAAELGQLLHKYRGTAQEPAFLEKLAEIQQQSAAMQFRVAHGLARKTGKPVDLSTYKKVMSRSIPYLTDLITRYPSFDDAARILFMRGKAYEETGAKAPSIRDYLSLVRSYPTSPEAVPAYMSLADFAIAANDWRGSIPYLRAIERQPNDPHFPVALYKLAWSFYNLQDIPAALGTAERLIGFYRAKGEQSKDHQLASSEAAMLDNMLHDVPLFYFGGFEQHNPNYTTPKAVGYFRKLDNGPGLGKMMMQYTYLIRTHDFEHELAVWKDTVLAEEPKRPESLDVLMTTYEYQLNKRRYADLVATSRDIVNYTKKNGRNEYSPRAEKLLLDTAAALQKLMIDNKDHGGSQILAQWLAPIYDAFTRIVPESDPRILTIHGNLAETLFAIKDYEGAAKSYRWVVEHGGSWSAQKSAKTGGIATAEASQKSISSRYESLREKKLIPGELNARPMPPKDPKLANAQIAEWLEWVDTHVSKSNVAIDNLEFEAYRTLYSQGRVNDATERLKSFALRSPKSQFALPAATLVVDTYIASGQWDRLESLASEFGKVEAWSGTPFAKRLYTVAADAKYKRVEQLSNTKDYQDTLTQAELFAEKYGNSEHLQDALVLAGNAASAIHNRSLAIAYYTKIAAASKASETSAKAVLAMARIEEERYAFSAATVDYLRYLSLPAKATGLDAAKTEKLKRRVLILAWLSGDPSQLHRVIANHQICDRGLRSECDRYEVLSVLMSQGAVGAKLARQAVSKATSAPASLRPIYAAIALEDAGRLSFETRHKMVQELSTHWKDMDPLARFSLMPRITVSVPRAFELDRALVDRSGKLRADEKSITRRLLLIREMETAATAAAKLPWSRIRVLVLDETAWVYNDLAEGIRHLPAPAKLRKDRDRVAYQRMVDQFVAPFEDKAQKIRGEAYQLASQSGVETEVFDRISQDYFFADPRRSSAAVAPKQRAQDRAALDLSLVRDVDSGGSWGPVNLDTAEPAQVLRSRWAEALDAHRWAQAGFFAQEARERGLLPAKVAGVADAVSIATAGARAEGAMALSDLCHGNSGEIKPACSAARMN